MKVIIWAALVLTAGQAHAACEPVARANLKGCDFTNAKLENLDLRGANLSGADLESADLTRANLTDAKLSGASARFARFVSADLTGADFTHADIIHAVWDQARNVPPSVLGALAARFGAEERRYRRVKPVVGRTGSHRPPFRQKATPTRSQRSGHAPSTAHSDNSDVRMWMPL
ncbi:hypothetical protein A6A05_07110 [Magnetospirillum moscoviense]|uniref:Pentapeptide repeat-containing protein n=1 Tax=Magnetospirillum moscoviense TaxID=1437059 RepID=A0A178MYA2_9PROT|nr:hypothetical protein A6A05_07110 [Magnetospirillum moscoviense]